MLEDDCQAASQAWSLQGRDRKCHWQLSNAGTLHHPELWLGGYIPAMERFHAVPETEITSLPNPEGTCHCRWSLGDKMRLEKP